MWQLHATVGSYSWKPINVNKNFKFSLIQETEEDCRFKTNNKLVRLSKIKLETSFPQLSSVLSFVILQKITNLNLDQQRIKFVSN